MPDKITYYAVVSDDTSIEQPFGLVRRLEFDGDGFTDETLQRDFSWGFTPIIAEWKHGDFAYELVEISHAQATQVIDNLRQERASG
jgi:hypothetical protein